MRLAIAITSMMCAAAHAQFPQPGSLAVHSMSGQFVVVPGPHAAPPRITANDSTLVDPNPALLVVSCERIRHAVLTELGTKAPWRGKIFLHPGASKSENITVVSERFRDGWDYRVALPAAVEKRRLVRALTETLLLEIANRSAADRSAEIPAWLAEGLTRHILAGDDAGFLFPPASSPITGRAAAPTTIVTVRKGDTAESARRVLRERPPPTLGQLSWPGDIDDEQSAFNAGAHLFTVELLRLQGGRECMTAFLGELGKVYNWQTAFLRAFKPHFKTLLDLEKWWSLQLAHNIGRDDSNLWSAAETALELGQILSTPVQVRSSAKEIPTGAKVSLQTIIRDWDFMNQANTLKVKLRELESARLRAARDFTPLVDDYRAAITGYLRRREHNGWNLPSSKAVNPNARIAVKKTLKELDALDARLAKLSPVPVAAQ